MGYILQKLDGLESCENRLIIATTNNPDKINPALLRPGRFDLKICLSLAKEEIIIDILSNFYGEEFRSKISGANLPGNYFSPLELINYAVQEPNCEIMLQNLKLQCEHFD